MRTRTLPLLLLSLFGCSPSPSTTNGGDASPPSPDGASGKCRSPFERPMLPPLGERRCLGLAAGQTFDPAAPGPFVVGVKTIEIADPLRPGRMLTTEVWYPAAESARGQPGTGYSVKFSDI